MGAFRDAVPVKCRRDLRLASGRVFFTYVTLHPACHAFGLISLDAAEAVGSTFAWRTDGDGAPTMRAGPSAHVLASALRDPG